MSLVPRLATLFVSAIAVGSTLLSQSRAGDFSPEVGQRIATAESNLIPVVRIKGHAAGKLAERMKQLRVPGVSVAVINDYKIEWAKGYGLADSKTQAPVTTETLFQAGSVSKPVAAMAALKLVEEGKLNLDRDVNAQLKSWKVPENKFTEKHPVDLRAILSHTAGFTVHGFPGYAVGKPIPTLPQIFDGVKPANTRSIRVDKVPGKGFRYSGGGTTVMQQLVIDVTGRPFPQVTHDLVLAPLAMTSSSYEQPLPADWAARTATAHNRLGNPIPGRWHIYPEMAAAGLWTTPSDVARYIIEVQLAHVGKSHKVLSHKMVEEMLTPQNGGPVGLGPFLEGSGSSRRFEHGGSDAGFICKFVGYLDRGQGAMVMTNSDNGGQLAEEVLNGIAVAYGWPDYLGPERVIVKLDPKTRDAYLGAYSLGFFGEMKVERRGDVLFAGSPAAGESELFFESETKFITDNPQITGRFVRDSQGQVADVIINMAGQEIHAKKKKP
ncbi:MAG TPA: serine hydrolase domain-containing protein [Planctomycetaceae bacterium]|jgi:CubicO group peptidase (beta-lactamase class C family)|nr:serine hydrolase domain-containing protein [Planctomycetaceae bacterium]